MSPGGQPAASVLPAASQPAALSATASRIPGLDALRGAAIVGVVLIHAAPSDAPVWNAVVVQDLARLAVPSFLLVSGYLHARRQTPASRLAAHALTFLRLHVLWALLHAILDFVDPAYAFSWSPRALLLHFGAGHWAGQFFLVVLVQVLLVAALIGGVGRYATAPILALAVAGWAAGTALMMAWKGGADLPLPLELMARARANPVWLWFVYFALGGVAARIALQSTRSRKWLAWGGVALGVLLALSDLPPTHGAAWADDLPYVRVSILLGVAAIGVALPALALVRAPRPLLALGRDSFAIFVLNPAVLRGLDALGGRPEGPIASLAFSATTLVLCVALAVALRRWIPSLLP